MKSISSEDPNINVQDGFEFTNTEKILYEILKELRKLNAK